MAAQYLAGITNGQVWSADIANQIGAAWETYTPTIKGGATTVTATINYARWARIQKTVFVQVLASVTSAGAANGIIEISLPAGLAVISPDDMRVIGTFSVKDTGTAYYHGFASATTGSTVSGTAYNAQNYMGANTPAMTLANGDEVAMSVVYEVA